MADPPISKVGYRIQIRIQRAVFCRIRRIYPTCNTQISTSSGDCGYLALSEADKRTLGVSAALTLTLGDSGLSSGA